MSDDETRTIDFEEVGNATDDPTRAARGGRCRRPRRAVRASEPPGGAGAAARGAPADARGHRHARVVRDRRRASRRSPRPRRSSPPNTGIKVKTNTVDHNTFQEQINSYLQGHPDDVFTWFAGYRMQFFAAKGLATSDRRRLEDVDAADAAGDQGRVDRRRRTPVPRARTRTIRGPSTTARASGRRRATRSRRRGTSSSRSPRRCRPTA